MAKKNNKKADKGLIAVTIAVILLVVFVIGVVAVRLVRSSGVVDRLTKVATSKTTSASECVLAYYEYESMEDQLLDCQYQWMYWSYGLMEDTDNIMGTFSDYAEYAIQLIGYYQDQGLYELNALSAVESYLALYEAAVDAGIELDDNDMKMLEENYDALTDSALAAKLGITSAPRLIKTYTGIAANKKDIMKAMKIQALANKYYNKYVDDKADGYGKEYEANAKVFDEYVNEHKSDLYKTTYKTYSYTAADEAIALALNEAKTAEEMHTILANVIADKNYSNVYKQFMDNVAEMPAELDTAAEKEEILNAAKETAAEETSAEETTAAEETTSEDTAEETVVYTYDEAKALVIAKLQSIIYDEDKKIKESGELEQAYDEKGSETYDDLTEAVQWIISAKDGETKFVSTPSEKDDDTTVSCVLYEIVKASHLDEALTRDYAYVSFDFAKEVAEDETTAAGATTRTKEDAKALADAFKKSVEDTGWMSAYSFQVAAALSKYSAEYSDSQVKSDVEDGEGVVGLNEWVFDKDTKAGDIEVIEGDGKYFVVMLVKVNAPAWVESVIDAKVSDDFTKFSKQAPATYEVKLKPKFQNKIDAFNEANATEAVTTAE